MVLVAVASAAVAILLQRDSRVTLFSAPLRPEQVSEVALRLAEWNVPFVTVADNVRVDARHRADLLLRLSLAGVPHEHVATSSELLERTGPLTPLPAIESAAREGLAGDLALALRGVAGIEDVRVIVAPPHPGTFADDAPHDATAAVRLTLHPGAAPPREVVAGIRAFVAAAVTGLDRKHVTVLDDRGVVLDDAPSGAATTNAALEASLQSALDSAFGVGATIVRVRLAYDPRLRELRDVRREPLAGHPIASARVDEQFASDKKRYSSVRSGEDRGSAVHEERTQIPPGVAETISAAVIVDAARNLDVAKVRAIAAAAIGLVPPRGDTLSVESVRFARPATAQPPVATAVFSGYAAALAPTLVTIICITLLLWVLARPVLATVERLELRKVATARPAPDTATIVASLRGEPPHVAAAVIRSLPAPAATAVLDSYAPEERDAIARRLAREAPPVLSGLETLLRRG